MKQLKTLSLLIMLISSSVQAFSQVELGAQLGVGATTQSDLGNICKNGNRHHNVNAGLLARYRTNDWFAIKSGLLWTQKGSHDDNADETYRIDYLELPVKAEFSSALVEGKASRIFLATGPYLASRLKAEYELAEATTKIKDGVKPTDFGWAFELGFELPAAAHKLLISLNYDMGISEVYKLENDIQNKALSLNLGFLF
ncbi:porin family protein [Sunxiuqinia sp. sy24]|uniref:porin family protein n=1 Tax=Sunxiuqinia sp. sy24 TaxID=3461495 RepID=UPI004045B7DE